MKEKAIDITSLSLHIEYIAKMIIFQQLGSVWSWWKHKKERKYSK